MGRANPVANYYVGTTNVEPEGGGFVASLPPVVTRNMGAGQILEIFRSRGTEDLTSQLDHSTTSQYPVAAGGFADIFRSRLRGGSEVAIKCLRFSLNWDQADKKAIKRIAHELYVWTKCKHPNILELNGVAIFRGQICIISPWMEYGTLPPFLSRYPNVSRSESCVQIAGAIAYLHNIGIVHGDIKGANVLVSNDHTIKLGSFGSAQISRHSIQFSESSGMRGVSFRWAAPETILEENQGPTLHTDVYSLGMTILEIISGLVPYHYIRADMGVLTTVLRRVLPERPELFSEDNFHDRLWSLLLRCWSIDPPLRPSASDVWEEMKELSATVEDGSHASFGIATTTQSPPTASTKR